MNSYKIDLYSKTRTNESCVTILSQRTLVENYNYYINAAIIRLINLSHINGSLMYSPYKKTLGKEHINLSTVARARLSNIIVVL